MTPAPTQQPTPAPSVRGWITELVGLVLLVAGVTGLSVTAFTVAWQLGVAVLSVGAIGLGWRMTTASDEE